MAEVEYGHGWPPSWLKESTISRRWDGEPGTGGVPLPVAPPAVLPAVGPWPTNEDALPQAVVLIDMAAKQPDICTLTFIPSLAQWNNANTAQNLVRVEWGTGGATTFVDFDLIKGCTIQVLASKVVARAQQMLIRGRVANPAAAPPTVGAFFVPGQTPRTPGTNAVQYTVQFGAPSVAGGEAVALMAPAAVHSWRVPRYAKAVRFATDPVNARLDILMQSANAVVPFFGMARYQLNAYPSPYLPIPAGADLINVTNAAAVNVLSYAMMFDLDL